MWILHVSFKHAILFNYLMKTAIILPLNFVRKCKRNEDYYIYKVYTNLNLKYISMFFHKRIMWFINILMLPLKITAKVGIKNQSVL